MCVSNGVTKHRGMTKHDITTMHQGRVAKQ